MLHQIKGDLWEKNLWIEPTISQSEQPKQVYSDHSVFSGVEDSSYFELLFDELLIHFIKFMKVYQCEDTSL